MAARGVSALGLSTVEILSAAMPADPLLTTPAGSALPPVGHSSPVGRPQDRHLEETSCRGARGVSGCFPTPQVDGGVAAHASYGLSARGNRPASMHSQG